MMMIKMLTAALMVMLKTVMNRIAKTLVTSIITFFKISIRLYSIVINEKVDSTFHLYYLVKFL